MDQKSFLKMGTRLKKMQIDLLQIKNQLKGRKNIKTASDYIFELDK